jgi:acylphosphatase
MAKLIHYSGSVQGVGFRMTAARLARNHPAVRGWVRNLPDGRVELFADGHRKAVESFLTDIRERMAEYISSEEATEIDADNSLTGFSVVY